MSIQYGAVMVSFVDSLEERGDDCIKFYLDLNVFILFVLRFLSQGRVLVNNCWRISIATGTSV